jgi:hypothetical protein
MKIDDALITAITRELFKRLEAGGDGSSAVKKPLVITGDALQAAARSGLEAEYDILCHDSLEASFPENAQVLVTKLSVQALTRVAEGDAGCTPEGVALLWALLRGKRPVIVEEGIEWRGFKDSMSPALAAKFNAHERTLASYGVVFVREAALSAGILNSAAGCGGSAPEAGKVCAAPVSGVPARGKSAGIGKRVISEIELMRLCPVAAGPGQVAEIGLKDILTPLAVDYAAKMQITVNRIE